MHDDPERRALAQPRHDVSVRVGGAGTSRLAHHAGAHDESHVRHEEMCCVAKTTNVKCKNTEVSTDQLSPETQYKSQKR